MTFTPRDVKDVSSLVAKKLELYLNQERREDRFDTQGRYRTHPKMRTLDLMYQMLDATEINKKTHRRKHRSSSSKRRESKKLEEEVEAQDESEHEERQKTGKKDRSRDKKKKIAPVVINNSLRVVPQNEAERLTDIANKVFEEQDLDKLHVIHRYRPNSRDIAPLTENGKVANYTLHVGSALNSTNYVNYYVREGLHSSKKDSAKRFQRLQTKNKEDSTKSSQDHETSPDGRKGQSSNNDDEQQIYNPLIDQSTESLLSTSLVSGNLTPLDKDKPAYSTVFTSTRPSSRGSSDRQSKASSQLNKARMFANGYGYRIVGDKSNGVGACDSTSRTESRADIANSEEYCKFSSAKNNSIDSGRTGDGVDAIVMSNIPPMNENDLDYNKFQSLQSSVLLSGLEENDSRAKSYYSNSRRSSQRSARSQRSYQSGNSSPVYMEGSMSACTEESDLYDTEVGPDTARSTSYPLSTPGRSNKRYKPIETLITTKEVPRLGLSSDINDSNVSSNSWAAEEYVTAEEKAKMNTDARAIEDKKNASQEREGDGVLGNSFDARADRSLQKVWSQEDGAQCQQMIGDDVMGLPEPLQATDAMVGSCMPSNTTQDKENQLAEPSPQQNTARSQGQSDPSNPQAEKEDSVKSEALLSGRTNKTLIDFGTDAGRSSSRSTTYSSKKVKGKEQTVAERGEDKIESMELHRGQVPDAEKNKLLKIKIERGDDTPRTMAAKGRLTKSAKKRGMSNYYTMGDEERGLEKEYFEPVEKDIQEVYIKAKNTDDEEDPETPASSRPTSASSCYSRLSGASDFDQRKKSVDDILANGKKSDSRPQSQVEKSVDGRGDDSVSIKSGSGASSVSGKGNTREIRSSGSDQDAKRQERYDGQNISKEPKSVDLSGGSRGSRSIHMKVGVGEGYCIEGEVLNRGYDESILRQPGGTTDTKREDTFKVATPKDGDNGESFSRGSKQLVKLISDKEDASQNLLNLSAEIKTEGIINSDSANKLDSIKKEESQVEGVRSDKAGNNVTTVENISHNASIHNIQKEEQQDNASLHQTICEDGEQGTGKNENIPEQDLNDATHMKDSINHSETKEIDQRSKHLEKVGTDIVKGEESRDTLEVTDQTFERNIKDSPDSKIVRDVSQSPKPKDAVKMPEEEAPIYQGKSAKEKAFVECDLSDQDVVKEAVSGSASMFNEDSDTVIDFRPSSASTAISVGREQSADHKRRPIQKPAKIAEVTETDSNFGSARESYRSSKAPEHDVLHPATKKKKQVKDRGAILNIADVKLSEESENGEISHPSIKKKMEHKMDAVSSRSASLPCSKSAALDDYIDIADLCDKDKKSQSVDQIPYSNIVNESINEEREASDKNVTKSDDKVTEPEAKEELVKKKSVERIVEGHDKDKATGGTHTDLIDGNKTDNGTNEIKDMPSAFQEKAVTETENVKMLGKEQESLKEGVKNGNELDVQSNAHLHSKDMAQETGNANQNNNLEEGRNSGKVMAAEENAKKSNEVGEGNTKKIEDIHAHKMPCAVDLMIDLAMEGNLAQDNVVADVISTNLKLNKETPRTPRPSENVPDNTAAIDKFEDKKEHQTNTAAHDECTVNADDKQLELSERQPKIQIDNGLNPIESQPKHKISEQQKEIGDNADGPVDITANGDLETELEAKERLKQMEENNDNTVSSATKSSKETEAQHCPLQVDTIMSKPDTIAKGDNVDTVGVTDQDGIELATIQNDQLATKQISQSHQVDSNAKLNNEENEADVFVSKSNEKTAIDITETDADTDKAKIDIVAGEPKTGVDAENTHKGEDDGAGADMENTKTETGAESTETIIATEKTKTDIDTGATETHINIEKTKTDLDTEMTKADFGTEGKKADDDTEKTKTDFITEEIKADIDSEKVVTSNDLQEAKTDADAGTTKADAETKETMRAFDTGESKAANEINPEVQGKDVFPDSQITGMKQHKEVDKAPQFEYPKALEDEKHQKETSTPSLELKKDADNSDIVDEKETVSESRLLDSGKVTLLQDDVLHVVKEEIKIDGESRKETTHQAIDLEQGLENENNQNPKDVDNADGHKECIYDTGKEKETSQAVADTEREIEKKEGELQASKSEETGNELPTSIPEVEMQKVHTEIIAPENEKGASAANTNIETGNKEEPKEMPGSDAEKENIDVKLPEVSLARKETQLPSTENQTNVEYAEQIAESNEGISEQITLENEDVKQLEDNTKFPNEGDNGATSQKELVNDSEPETNQLSINNAGKTPSINPVDTNLETPEVNTLVSKDQPLGNETMGTLANGKGDTLKEKIQDAQIAPTNGIEGQKISSETL